MFFGTGENVQHNVGIAFFQHGDGILILADMDIGELQAGIFGQGRNEVGINSFGGVGVFIVFDIGGGTAVDGNPQRRQILDILAFQRRIVNQLKVEVYSQILRKEWLKMGIFHVEPGQCLLHFHKAAAVCINGRHAYRNAGIGHEEMFFCNRVGSGVYNQINIPCSKRLHHCFLIDKFLHGKSQAVVLLEFFKAVIYGAVSNNTHDRAIERV